MSNSRLLERHPEVTLLWNPII